jgi:ribose-phosphate pyrophosphokinase
MTIATSDPSGVRTIAAAPIGEFAVIGGTAAPDLARAVANELHVSLAAATAAHFPDGETAVELLETVRGKTVFVVQPTGPPVNDNLIELLAFADACRRASAAHVCAVMPYFGYARSDKRHGRREPITASMVARLIQAVGIDRVIAVDLHASQIEGFFQIPVDSLSAVSVICDALQPHVTRDTVVVSPDVGRLRMATDYAERLQTPVVVLHKVRESGRHTHVMHVVGDVRDRPCLIVDDMISTGGTLADGMRALLDAGARAPMFIAATHGLLLPGSRSKLVTPAVARVFVTDTVNPGESLWPNLHVVSVARLLAQAIRRIIADGGLAESTERASREA